MIHLLILFAFQLRAEDAVPQLPGVGVPGNVDNITLRSCPKAVMGKGDVSRSNACPAYIKSLDPLRESKFNSAITDIKLVGDKVCKDSLATWSQQDNAKLVAMLSDQQSAVAAALMNQTDSNMQKRIQAIDEAIRMMQETVAKTEQTRKASAEGNAATVGSLGTASAKVEGDVSSKTEYSPDVLKTLPELIKQRTEAVLASVEAARTPPKFNLNTLIQKQLATMDGYTQKWICVKSGVECPGFDYPVRSFPFTASGINEFLKVISDAQFEKPEVRKEKIREATYKFYSGFKAYEKLVSDIVSSEVRVMESYCKETKVTLNELSKIDAFPNPEREAQFTALISQMKDKKGNEVNTKGGYMLEVPKVQKCVEARVRVAVLQEAQAGYIANIWKTMHLACESAQAKIQKPGDMPPPRPRPADARKGKK